jgi:hypothetical protein
VCGGPRREASNSEAARAADAATDTSLLKRTTITAPRFQGLSGEDSTPYAVLAFDANQSCAKAARNVVQRE